MGSHTIWVLCIVLTASQIVFGKVWEFGTNNVPGSFQIFQEDGHIGVFEHEKKIKLPVPQCDSVTYVSVEVNNLISTPTVQYDPNTFVVTINYSTFSSSLSSFTIVGQAVWIPGCNVVNELPHDNEPRIQNDQVVFQ